MSREKPQTLMVSRCCSIALAIALSSALALAARAEVHVDGNAAAVRVTTSQDSIGSVLTALGPPFNIQYRSAIDLDAAANPTYAGTIERVIANLLDGFNYIVKRNADRTEIIILGRRGEVAIPPPAPKPAS